MSTVDSSQHAATSNIVSELQREYRTKQIVFCLLLCVTVLLRINGSGAPDQIPMILMFAIVVDLMAIRRCIRICNSLTKPSL